MRPVQLHDPIESEVAHALAGAAGTGLTATDVDRSLTIDAGYRVQRWVHARRVDAGAHTVGWKVGVTSTTAQRRQGLQHPLLGYLLADSVVDLATSGPVPPLAASTMLAPRVEIEIAFVMALPLAGAGLSVEDVLAATSEIRLALEIVDSRWEGGAPGPGALVADNVSNAATLLGDQVPLRADLTGIDAVLSVGGRRSSGGSDQVMGAPTLAVAWLAGELVVRTGRGLAPGDIVLSGTLCPPLPVASGDEIVADYGMLGALRTSEHFSVQ